MKILFDLGHPAHVHFFKYIMRNLEKDGHTIKICIRERENIVKNLLTVYGFPYESLEKNKPGLLNKCIGMIKNDWKLYKISTVFEPDLFVSLGSPYSAQVSRLIHKPSIVFTDSEPTQLILSLTVPFADTVITPIGFDKGFGAKHVRINGFKETAYLHPNRYIPNPEILDILGIKNTDKYVIFRFNAFDSSHDYGIRGFTLEDKQHMIRLIKNYARVFISSEIPLPKDLSEYAIQIPPHMMHDALYYASLLISDTQTSTTEAACLGTPAIRCNSFVGSSDMSNFVELEQKYRLIFNYTNPESVMKRAIELITKDHIKDEWAERRKILFNDKIDVTTFMTDFIERYPDRLRQMKRNKNYISQ